MSDTAEKWFVCHRRPHVLGHISWYGAYRTEDEARAALPEIQAAWRKRAGIQGPCGYTYVERDDADTELDYGQQLFDPDLT